MDKGFNEPLWKIYHYIDVNKQLEKEVGDFLDKNTAAPKLYSNDLRHQYASAIYTRNKGAKAAKFLGDLNELTDFNASGREDTEIDQKNNQIGREYGLKYPNLPKGQLLYKLLTDWNKKNL